MTGKVEIRKAKLRETLIDVAEAQIVAGGIGALKARPIAQAAGCSVGAIYNIFEDLEALSMAVNGRTFRRLGSFVSERVEAAAQDTPNAQMIVMSHAYLHFASHHTHLWRALFDLEMSVDGHVPAWYLKELGDVFALIDAPLRRLFSAVHGIVLLGLERRISAVPQDQIEMMLAQVLGEIGNS